jgi:hypothetical protein
MSGNPRRPRSLTQQSVSSIHAFSMFGSVDSEQSLPRTAPLATPEQVKIITFTARLKLNVKSTYFFAKNFNKLLFHFIEK